MKHILLLLFLTTIPLLSQEFSVNKVDSNHYSFSLENNIIIDSLFSAKILNEFNTRLDSLNYILKNNLQKNESGNKNFTFWLSLFAIFLNIILSIIAVKQYNIIQKNEKSSLSAYTFIELTKTPPLNTSNEVFIKDYIKFYISLNNTNISTIDDIWIKFPSSIEITIGLTNGNSCAINVFNIKKPIFAASTMIIYFDQTTFFNENFKLLENTSPEIMILYKNSKEAKYHSLTIPFEIKRHESNVKSDYSIGVSNCLTIVDNEFKAYDKIDLSKLKQF